MGLVVNGRVETHLAVAVTMEIAEMNVARVENFDGPWKRLKGTDDAVGMEIGKCNVAR